MNHPADPPRPSGESSASRSELPKTPTGIHGFDEVTGGGLPRGRAALVCGSAGCGKTLFAMEFLVRGATRYDEPGLFVAFEETGEELAQNVRSLGFDLEALKAQKKVVVDYVRVERSEIEETGLYDLDGLFIRLAHAIESVQAKRVVLDTLEALFSGLDNHAVLRAELRRLFRWLKDRGMTAVITGERGAATLTRYGLEEYVADCVIELDHRVSEQISTRRLRVVKYRGSAHGTNEYPFLIGSDGLSVLPITSLRLDHAASAERVPTGIAKLDEMLGGKGIFRDSSMLVSGAPGTGKSSVGASFADAACARGEKVMLFAYEESAAQLTRNMRSIGVDLGRWVKKGRLHIHASRPTLQGLEQHLVFMYGAVRDFRPNVVVIDPISNLSLDRDDAGLKPTLIRLIDFLKQNHVTAVFTSLIGDSGTALAETQIGVSSLMDTWLLLSNLEANGERTRALQVIKSRGMPHSNQVREFVLTDRGIDLIDVFVAEGRVLTGRLRRGAEGGPAAGEAPIGRRAAAKRMKS
jgi:circadian clock protein KaiC